MNKIKDIIVSLNEPQRQDVIWLRPNDRKILWNPRYFKYPCDNSEIHHWQIIGDYESLVSMLFKIHNLEDNVTQLNLLWERAVMKDSDIINSLQERIKELEKKVAQIK